MGELGAKKMIVVIMNCVDYTVHLAAFGCGVPDIYGIIRHIHELVNSIRGMISRH
jgi:hypothetical protein